MKNPARKSISDRFLAIDSQINDLGALEFFSNRHKRLREWHVLGAMQRLLKGRSQDFPDFAEENLRPDFITYRSDGTPWHPVEITEVLRPGDRRHDRYRQANKGGPRVSFLPPALKRPWDGLQNQISKKAKAGYDRETCLLVYLQIWLFDLPHWSEPVHAQLLTRHEGDPFRDIDKFSRVFVLSSGMHAMVELT